MSKFQLVVIAVFGLFIVAGVAAFSLKDSSNRKEQASPVLMWGTIDQGVMSKFLKTATEMYKEQLNISYVQKNKNTIETELVEAIANGKSPDMILVASDQMIMTQRSRIFPIPYTSFSERAFKDTFAEASEIFLTPTGVLALPIGVDPLIMYWNRDLLSGALITVAPKSWDEFFSLAEKVTKRSPDGNIAQSAVALGDMDNVLNGKELLSALIMQGGSPIVKYDYTASSFVATLRDTATNSKLVPAEQALSFYTEFANPSKSSYSWNRSLPDSLTSFLAGRLAIYFGFASELVSVRNKNPNLNFDISLVPQIKDSPTQSTYGRVYGLSIMSAAKNPTGAFVAVNLLTSDSLVDAWFKTTHIPTARRTKLSVAQPLAYESVIFKSAIVSKTWPDPDPRATSTIFKEMVDSVTSGRAKVSVAVDRANGDISNILRRYRR